MVVSTSVRDRVLELYILGSKKKFIDTDGTLQHPIPAAAPGKWRKTNEETARWSEDRQVKGGERLSSPRTVDNSEVA